MSKLFDEEVRGQLKAIFDEMKSPVTIEFFTEPGAPSGEETRGFLTEITELTDQVTVHYNEMPEAQAKADEYGIQRLPGFALLDEAGKDNGIQFYGLPGGHEINSFIYALMQVGGSKEELPGDLAEEIAGFDKDINIKVFVTLGCPHCPGAVSKAHRLALENPRIKAEMIDANLFPELSKKHNVSSVPKIIFNDGQDLLGNQPVEAFMNAIRELSETAP